MNSERGAQHELAPGVHIITHRRAGDEKQRRQHVRENYAEIQRLDLQRHRERGAKLAERGAQKGGATEWHRKWGT
jgi:hypothetical protein